MRLRFEKLPYERSLWDHLGPLWEELLTRSGEASPYLSSAWIRAWLEAFGPEARPSALVWRNGGGVPVACALLSTRSAKIGPFPVRRSFLNASGAGPMPEHNDVLACPEARGEVLGDLVGAVLGSGADELSLVGVPDATAKELVSHWPSPSYEGFFGEAPYVSLDRIRSRGQGFLATLSSSTRWQIRRSIRRYAERFGEPRFEVATDPERANQWLEELIALHNARWRPMGEPGAFFGERSKRFHGTLLAGCSGASAPGELRVDLGRLRFGETPIGFLYNLGYKARVSFLQSGLRYDDDNRLKPGLVAHALAVEHYLAAGESEYDFLGGESEAVRYKRSLSTDARMLAWIQLSAPTVKMRAIGALRRLRRAARRA
jgi:CelD/BcsL family acetyltransferase involved in cellulose biosynthesis